jgi:hypothetical protein
MVEFILSSNTVVDMSNYSEKKSNRDCSIGEITISSIRTNKKSITRVVLAALLGIPTRIQNPACPLP